MKASFREAKKNEQPKKNILIKFTKK